MEVSRILAKNTEMSRKYNVRSKSEIRKEMLARRDALTKEEVKLRSECICRNVLQVFEERKSQGKIRTEGKSYILGYVAKGNEVDVWSFFTHIWTYESNVQIAVPRVSGKNMDFYVIQSFEDLEDGRFGLKEPKWSMKKVDKQDLQKNNSLVLVPGLAFSKDNRQRIGYGAGYYDIYFTDMTLDLYGIAYDFQIFEEEFEFDAFDVAMQDMITDM